jgi:peptidoglycan/xylan/chitin deacetylase (PgdA/CDA1 family)
MEEGNKKAADKHERVWRLKRCNIHMLLISVIMLIALCGCLLVRIRGLNGTIEKLVVQVEQLSRLAQEQQARLEQLTEELLAAEKGTGTSGSGEGSGQDMGQEGDRKDEIQETAAQVGASHKVYLTFDDGPSTHTQEILDILDDYGIKATFFVVGKEGEIVEESLKRIVEEGHTLGMHSGSHKYAELYASVDSFAEDFKKQQDYLYEITGVRCTLYRFPGGSANSVSESDMVEFARYLDKQGVRFFDWNISSGDGGSVLLPVETIVENCTENIPKYGTSVILMHDSAMKTTTLDALPTIIETIMKMEDTEILPITDETKLVQQIKWQEQEQNGERTSLE